MRSPTQEWWRVVFDASYPRIYKFTDQTIERDVGFLTDVLKLRQEAGGTRRAPPHPDRAQAMTAPRRD
jgi:hypothetical protein